MNYELVRQIYSTGNVKFYEARLAGFQDLCVAKVLEPCFVGDEQLFLRQKQDFISAAKLQKELASPNWAAIYNISDDDQKALYFCQKYDRSLRDIIDSKLNISPNVLLNIVTAVCNGLVDLSNKLSRPSGNIKPGNILVRTGAKDAVSDIVLTDMSPDYGTDRRHCAADLRAVGKIIFELVLHRPAPQSDSLRLTDVSEWKSLGDNALQWMQLCEKLLQATSPVSDYTLEMFSRDLSLIKHGKHIKHIRLIVALAVVIVIAGVFFGYIWNKKNTPTDVNQWKQICAENFIWIQKLYDERKHFEKYIPTLEDAYYPQKKRHGKQICDIYNDSIEELKSKGVENDRIIGSLKAIEDIRKLLDIENPESIECIMVFRNINECAAWEKYEGIKAALCLPKSISDNDLPESLDDELKVKDDYRFNVDNFALLIKNYDKLKKINEIAVQINKLIKSISPALNEKATNAIQDTIKKTWISCEKDKIEIYDKEIDSFKTDLQRILETIDLLKSLKIGEYDMDLLAKDPSDFKDWPDVSKDYKQIELSEFYGGYAERIKELEKHLDELKQNADATAPLKYLDDFKGKYESPQQLNDTPHIEKSRKVVKDVYDQLSKDLEEIERNINSLLLTPEKLREKIKNKAPFDYDFISEKWQEKIGSKEVKNVIDEKEPVAYDKLKKLQDDLDDFYGVLKIWNDCLVELDDKVPLCDPDILEIFKTSYHNKSKIIFNDNKKWEQIRNEFNEFKINIESVIAVLKDSNSLEEGFGQLKFSDDIGFDTVKYNTNLKSIKSNEFYIGEVKEYIDKIDVIVRKLDELKNEKNIEKYIQVISQQNVPSVIQYYVWEKLLDFSETRTTGEWRQKIRDVRNNIYTEIEKIGKPELDSRFNELDISWERMFYLSDVVKERDEIKKQIEDMQSHPIDSPNLTALLTSMKTAFSNLSDGLKGRLEQHSEKDTLDSEFSKLKEELGAVKELVRTIGQFTSDLDNKEYDYRLMFRELELVDIPGGDFKIEQFATFISKIDKTDYERLKSDPRREGEFLDSALDSRKNEIESQGKKDLEPMLEDLIKIRDKHYDLVNKNKDAIDKDVEKMRSILEQIRAALKPPFCKYVDFKDDKVVFSDESGLQDKAVPVMGEDGLDISNDDWVKIKNSTKSEFFEEKNDSGSWPKYIKSNKDESVIFKFVKGDSDTGSFYMSIKEITNEQFCNYMNSEGAIGRYGFETEDKPGFEPEQCDRFYVPDSLEDVLGFSSGGYKITIYYKGSGVSYVKEDADKDLPVASVTFHGAESFAQYLDGKLPNVKQHQFLGDSILREISDKGEIDGLKHVHLLTKGSLKSAFDGFKRVRDATIEPVDAYGSIAEKSDAFKGDSDPWPTVAAKREPDGNGFYDIVGNVSEWCEDKYICGFSCMTPKPDVLDRSKYSKLFDDTSHVTIGFRVVLPIE